MHSYVSIFGFRNEDEEDEDDDCGHNTQARKVLTQVPHGILFGITMNP